MKSEGGHEMQGSTSRSLEITKTIDGYRSRDTASAIPTLVKCLRD
jgi:hypothetical protein